MMFFISRSEFEKYVSYWRFQCWPDRERGLARSIVWSGSFSEVSWIARIFGTGLCRGSFLLSTRFKCSFALRLDISINVLVKAVGPGRVSRRCVFLEGLSSWSISCAMNEALYADSSSGFTSHCMNETFFFLDVPAPGVRRIPFVGEANGSAALVRGWTSSCAMLFGFIVFGSIASEPSKCSLGTTSSTIFDWGCTEDAFGWGVPKIAVLNARIAKICAGVSGGSSMHEAPSSAERKSVLSC